MIQKVHTQRLQAWQWFIVLPLLALWVIQMVLAVVVVASPGANRNWGLYTKHDFDHYYRTSERVTGNSAFVYCVPFSVERNLSGGIKTGDIREPTNPPLLTVALSPIAYTNPARAWTVYMILSLLATLWSLWVCIRRWQQSTPRHLQAKLLLFIMLSPCALSLFIYSQVQGFVLALCIASFALARQRPLVSGISLGIGIALKAYVAPLLAFLFLTERYRVFAVALLTALLGTLLPGYFDPRLSFAAFASCGLPHIQEWALQVGNQGITGALLSFLRLAPLPSGWIDLGAITPLIKTAAPLLWFGSVAGLGMIFRKRGDFDEGLLAALAICVICAPVAWPHYYVLVWPYLIREWERISFGSKIILWLSLPLISWYVAPGPHSLTSIFTEPPGPLLPWLPVTIFIAQFFAILFTHTLPARLADCARVKK